jgi:hypothetical protein
MTNICQNQNVLSPLTKCSILLQLSDGIWHYIYFKEDYSVKVFTKYGEQSYMRRIYMLRKFTAFLLMVSLVGSFFTNVSAEESFQAEKFPYKEMQVQVMPEFDYPDNWPKEKPALLVGYFGTFINKSGSEYNGEISFPLPVDETEFEMYLAAEFPEENKPEVQVEYTIDKEQKAIVWKPTKPIENGDTYKYVIEYYANPIKVSDNKSFNYSFNPPADIEQLDIVFYAPVNAKDFKLDQKATNQTKSEYGEEIHHFQYLEAKKGKNLTYNASYVKADNTSSMSVISTMDPPQDDNHKGVTGTTATEQVLNSGGSTTKNANRPIIDTTGAVIIGVSMIIMGVFVFLGFKGKGVQPTPKKPVTKTQTKEITNNNKKGNSKENEKKELRKMLTAGEIDQQTYNEKIKKLG